MKSRLLTFSALVVLALGVSATSPDDEAWLITAGHGPGAEGSFWVTDLFVMNPSDEEIEVMVTYLPRGTDNEDAEGEVFEIGAESLLVLEDVVSLLSDDETTFGALHVEVVEEEDEDEDELRMWIENDGEIDDYLEEETPILVYGRAYDRSGEGTRGQALAGLSRADAISAGSVFGATHVIGVSSGSDYRSNWFALNVSENEEDVSTSASLLVTLLDSSGEVLGERLYTMMPGEPLAASVEEISAANFENGVLRFEMEEGAALVAASRIDRVSNDGTTLGSFTNSIDPRSLEFTSTFDTERCTFSSIGSNPYFPLQPGFRTVLEGEDDGELATAIIEVTDQTRMVDGVMTRVVTETESEDGELVEISYNFFAECTETGDVFYFGEDVDDYEDGEIVGHEGEWLAGENGATAGIIMPGSPVVGSRYYQEIAPGVALDRAEHLAFGLEFETEVGSFEHCLVVRDTSALEPDDSGDLKVYCPGIGVVVDEDLEVVEWTPAD